jgi:hypothetical protein
MLRDDSVSRYLSEALASLPGPLAQLLFLASLRDHYTGRYVHEGWAGYSTPEEVHELLMRKHREVFEFMGSHSLIDFSRELRSHFRALGEDEARVVALWRELEPYKGMIPEGCSRVSRELFSSQLGLALEVLAKAPDWEYLQVPDASPPPPPGPPPPRPYLN